MKLENYFKKEDDGKFKVNILCTFMDLARDGNYRMHCWSEIYNDVKHTLIKLMYRTRAQKIMRSK